MKKQITALVTYKSGSRHLVCFNEYNQYPSFLGRTIYISGYVIDSENLSIGMAMSQKITELTSSGLLDKQSFIGLDWCDEIDVIEVEYYPNWLDKLLNKGE